MPSRSECTTRNAESNAERTRGPRVSSPPDTRSGGYLFLELRVGIGIEVFGQFGPIVQAIRLFDARDGVHASARMWGVVSIPRP